ncbi:unnamed protein product [Ranitomeya imitator]|uniref:P-type ATPase A domain-containing protein n=1 Tax=Ranitomeya imitator TaxID=111125 RepID=A0ABN9LGH6_9NEOB|nr:unnamed protein product [Ranitomeya imitator]
MIWLNILVQLLCVHSFLDCNQVDSCHLVPGDVIVLSGKGFSMSCDAILINGTCVVNEGMLTGESIPVTKTQLPNGDDKMPWKQYSGEDYKRHVLFCGTEVIRTESTAQGPARAVVLRTGFNTIKGDMVRSILYPKPLNFKFDRDVRWFYIFLTFLAIIGLIYAVTIYALRKGKHRVTKRGPALSNPMFTLVTGIVGRWRAVFVTALQRPNRDAAAIDIVVGIAAKSLSVKDGNQGKHRVTKRGPANPMFTLVTGIVGRWRAVCVTALQRPNSDAAAIRIVVIAAASLNVKGPLH